MSKATFWQSETKLFVEVIWNIWKFKYVVKLKLFNTIIKTKSRVSRMETSNSYTNLVLYIFKSSSSHYSGRSYKHFSNHALLYLCILAECSLRSHPSRRHMAGIQKGSNLEFERNRPKIMDFSLNKRKRFTHCRRAASPFHEFFI